MGNKLYMTEKELNERVGKQCEMEFARLSEGLFKTIGDKYEAMIKEQTMSEIDKVNNMIKEQCPEHGVLVLSMDKNEIQVPFSPFAKVEVTGYIDDSNKTILLEWNELNDINERTLLDVFGFIKAHKSVRIKSVSTRDVDMYDKEAFENEGKVVKNTKHYYNNYTSYVKSDDVKGIYLINTKLD